MSTFMFFMRHTAGHTLFNHKINEDIVTELQTAPVVGFIWHCRRNWRVC